jgi:hypothetical protein
MIICYQGTPGSGKSYDAVIKIIANLRKGRVVYTNIDGLGDPVRREFIMKKSHLTEMQLDMQLIHWDTMHSQSDREKVCNFTQYVEPRSLVVIDEIHKYFNARDWQSEKNKTFCEWGSTHRHHGFDMLMLTQDYEKVDKQVRSLIEYTYEYKKINFMGSKVTNRFIIYSYSGEPTGKYITKSYGTYDKSIFHCYDSYITRDIKELPVQKHANIFKHPVFFAIPVLIIIFVVLFFKSGFSKGEIIPGANKALELTKHNKDVSVVSSVGVVSSKRSGNVQVIEYKDLKNGVSLQQNQKASVPINSSAFSGSSFPAKKSRAVVKTIAEASELCDLQGFVKNADTEYLYYRCDDREVIFHDGVLYYSFIRDKNVSIPISSSGSQSSFVPAIQSEKNKTLTAVPHSSSFPSAIPLTVPSQNKPVRYTKQQPSR